MLDLLKEVVIYPSTWITLKGVKNNQKYSWLEQYMFSSYVCYILDIMIILII